MPEANWPNQTEVVDGVISFSELSQEPNLVDEDDETDLELEMEH